MKSTTVAPGEADPAPVPTGAPPSDELVGGFTPGPLGAIGDRWRTGVAAAVGALVVVGLVLRFWARSPLWLDEALTVDIARLPLGQIHAALKQDGAPPLFYVILHFWMELFGQSDLATRALSGLFSVATVPVAWVAARRYGGRPLGWAVVVLLVSSPFAIYYATEVRMYALVMLLTACGFVAVERALTRPRAGNLVAVAVCVAGLLYSQYWSLYLVASLSLWLAWQAWRGIEPLRRHARRTLAAAVVGGLTFVPWLPTFIFQSHYTGTPWSAAPNFTAILSAVTGFTVNQAVLSTAATNSGRILAISYFVLGFLGLFGLAADRLHVSLDIRSQPRGRPLAFVIIVTLAAAVAGGIISQSAFSPRYAAVVFIPLILLAAMGAVTLADARARVGLLVVAALASLSISVQNVSTERTQAAPVAAVLAAQAQPGDIVAYCPDQLGPAVYRLTAGSEYRQLTFPRGTGPDLVNWVRYQQAVNAGHAQAFVTKLEALAGTTHRIWLVWAVGYQGYGPKCQTIAADLLKTPNYGGHNWINQRPAVYYEPMSLTQYNYDGPAVGATRNRARTRVRANPGAHPGLR